MRHSVGGASRIMSGKRFEPTPPVAAETRDAEGTGSTGSDRGLAAPGSDNLERPLTRSRHGQTASAPRAPGREVVVVPRPREAITQAVIWRQHATLQLLALRTLQLLVSVEMRETTGLGLPLADRSVRLQPVRVGLLTFHRVLFPFPPAGTRKLC